MITIAAIVALVASVGAGLGARRKVRRVQRQRLIGSPSTLRPWSPE